MARDNAPKVRQARRLVRQKSRRASYDRILIVSEGSKTEPQYFEEIKQHYKLHSANVQMQPSAAGTEPMQVVEFAQNLFLKGDKNKGVEPRAFEQVYVVFDRDDHLTYHNALAKAKSINGRLKSDLGVSIKFEAIASVPCFELWLLLHFEDILSPMDRVQVCRRLTHHLGGYSKGGGGHFKSTYDNLPAAILRATSLANKNTAHSEPEPFTDICRLVELLMNLKN